MQFSVYQESHIGGRKVNQDRMGYSYTREALLLVLADGMGGHLRGEVAATIALQTFSALFQQQAKPYVKGPERFLEEACLAAHREIHRYSALENLPDTPRTTIVACLIQHNMAIWAHCGDSRLYWLRGGQLMARTRDHSHVEKLIDRGTVPASARASHPDRNKLYSCLGASSLPRVEVSGRASLLPGDQMLLCSDGLWAMVPEEQVLRTMAGETIVRAVPELLQAALVRAGERSDNVTALAIMWQGSTVVDSAQTSAAALSTMVSTEALAEDAPSTTVAGGFNDDDIEKAIAEIRMAIEKSSQILK
ncbi:PP2C family protein-serine/threonine phosphatase [Massilia sp. SM-13]|uniref:PP2C family protein-serine/threonine phosphatase n=1 Tax=Pseudoduganella rhizocola TaxID=3382643 RepID=UPI0038B6A194